MVRPRPILFAMLLDVPLGALRFIFLKFEARVVLVIALLFAVVADARLLFCTLSAAAVMLLRFAVVFGGAETALCH